MSDLKDALEMAMEHQSQAAKNASLAIIEAAEKLALMAENNQWYREQAFKVQDLIDTWVEAVVGAVVGPKE